MHLALILLSFYIRQVHLQLQVILVYIYTIPENQYESDTISEEISCMTGQGAMYIIRIGDGMI